MANNAPPSTFGPYRVGPPLGQGDMGTVYQAQDTTNGEVVALKILDRVGAIGVLKRGSAVELVEFAASLAHERLHKISRVVTTEGEEAQLGIAMPLAKSRSVYDHLNAGRKIPPKNAFQIISQIAAGLQFLHEQEVAHGSVKL